MSDPEGELQSDSGDESKSASVELSSEEEDYRRENANLKEKFPRTKLSYNTRKFEEEEEEEEEEEIDDEAGLERDFSYAKTSFTPFNMKREIEEGELDTLSFYNKTKDPEEQEDAWIDKVSSEDAAKVSFYFQHSG